MHSLQGKFCVNTIVKRYYIFWIREDGVWEEEDKQCTVEGPPACLRGSKQDTAYDLTNNVSFCTTDSGTVYLISKNGH